MKKILVKDKKHRLFIKNLEIKHFILKQILNNNNFQKTTKWNASYKLTSLPKNCSKTYISNRCVKTINKKSFHKFSKFSRMVFLKSIRNGHVSGMRKSCW